MLAKSLSSPSYDRSSALCTFLRATPDAFSRIRRLLLAPLEQRRLDRLAVLLEPEDVDRHLEQPLGEEQLDLLVAEPLDVQRAARHEMLELLDRLRRADQLAGAAPPRIRLAGLLVDLAHRRRAADRADLGKHVGLRILRPLLEDHLDDLRDHVARPLDHDRVADHDLGAVADRRAEAVEALDVVLVVERDVDHRHAAHRHRIEPPDRRQRAGAADLDVDLPQHRRRLLGRELVRDRPARLAGDKAPALAAGRAGRSCRRRRRCRSRGSSAAPRSAGTARAAPRSSRRASAAG